MVDVERIVFVKAVMAAWIGIGASVKASGFGETLILRNNACVPICPAFVRHRAA